MQMSAPSSAQYASFQVTRQSPRLRAERFADLDRVGTDSSGATVQQDQFSRLQLRDVDEVGPHSAGDFRDARGRDEVDVRGSGMTWAWRYRNLLSVAAASQQCAYLVANG